MFWKICCKWIDPIQLKKSKLEKTQNTKYKMDQLDVNVLEEGKSKKGQPNLNEEVKVREKNKEKFVSIQLSQR